jgi:hypothetical protein
MTEVRCRKISVPLPVSGFPGFKLIPHEKEKKRRFTKISLLIVVVACALSLTSQALAENVKIAMVLPGNISDKSWNQAGYEGLMRVKTELGFEVAYSVWLSMNVLVLDPKTICVEASEVHQQEQLDKLGFEIVPVPFRDAYPFGGALHCATTDVYREGICEDYFPKQVEGF